jgi:hypothetical protein
LHGGKNWKKIAAALPGKTEVQCLHRWSKVLNPKLTKGPWTDEVSLLVNIVVGLKAELIMSRRRMIEK